MVVKAKHPVGSGRFWMVLKAKHPGVSRQFKGINTAVVLGGSMIPR